jgi:hypothetical protein
MNILDLSIKHAGGVGRLADELHVRQNVVSNWRSRGLPKPWEQVLRLKYGFDESANQSVSTRQTEAA